MLGSLKDSLAQAMEGKTSCLFLSGGTDSLLLLYALLDIDADFSVMTFDETYSPEQKRVIDELVYAESLRVFSYKPQLAYFVGDGKRLAFIEEYGLLGGKVVPFIRDCVGGEKCSYDVIVETRPRVPIGFDLNIFGTRKTDRHWSFGKAFPGPQLDMQHGEIIAPLWEWTRADVRRGLKSYALSKPLVDTGNYEFCTRCLEGNGRVFCPKQQQEIDSVDWDARAMLDAFQTKFKGRTTK